MILDEVENMMSASMHGRRQKAKVAGGQARWIAGVVPRLRWAFNILHAVVTAVDKDVTGGVEEQRRRSRKDTRDKVPLVATKRCVVPLRWVAALMTHFLGGLRQEASLQPSQSRWVVVTDASSWGGGAVFCDASVL